MALRFLTAGESHGPCLIAIIEGMPAGLCLSEAEINADLRRRQGGYGRGQRMEIERDEVEMLSGVANGLTTGAPIALRIENKDWATWQDREVPPWTVPRPGHADLAGAIKYGFSDLRLVAERASARETAARVAVGAVARRLLAEFGIAVNSYVAEIGGVVAEISPPPSPPQLWGGALWERAEASDVRCPDPTAAEAMRQRIDQARAAGDSLGGVFVVVATGVPVGLGSHVHWDRRLDARLAGAVMSIPAIKGVEIGPAFENARKRGTEVHDEIFTKLKAQSSKLKVQMSNVKRYSNRAGGIEGGMSNGEPIVVRAAMKPIPTTVTPLQSVDLVTGEAAHTQYQRSDVCAVPAASVVGEAMVSWVIADALMEKLGGDSIEEMKSRWKWASGQVASGQVASDLRTCKLANLIITGFMGSGKSEVGREVARRLGREFVDMDTLIEQRVGMAIPDIFAQRGEGFFRQQERQLCQELAQRHGLVIATGGGALIPEENRQVLGTNGLLVCLNCDVEEILRRLAKVENRPLLDVADRRERIEALLAQRREAYSRIPHHIDTTGLTVEEVAERVIRLLTEKIVVRTPTGSYPIHLGEGLLAQVGELVREQGLQGKVALVTNPTVGELYAPAVIRSLREAGFEPVVCQVPDGEVYKTLDTVSSLYDQFIKGGLDRSGAVLALGGGVIGDMAGFAAATYMRGVPLVQLPTTLLAMVDASIGGKVAVDHPRGKNLIGAFKQPELVVIDPLALATLGEAEMRCGWAEVIKAGIIGSPSLFEQLEEGDQPLLPVIAEAIGVKVAIVEEDPYERGRRAVLNLGHTFGHALEVLSGFTLRHGEAVSIGLVAATRTAIALGLCDETVARRLAVLLQRFGLPTRYGGYEPGEIWEAMAADKKKRGKKLRFVLPRAIGQIEITDQVPRAVVLGVLERLRER